MQLKRKLLQNAKLYLILDAQVNTSDELLLLTQKALAAGVDIFQLRAKYLSMEQIAVLAKEIRDIIKGEAIFILNDNPQLAADLDIDGVHVGQNDTSVKAARKYIGDGIVGFSCQTFEQALQAENEGADYIGFGSVFKTKTKPEREVMDLNLLKKVVEQITIPVFPIGGITAENSKQLYNLGVRRFAVCRAISEAMDVELEVTKFLTFCS